MQIRRLIRGDTPLLISMPHIGTFLPPDIKRRMTQTALKLPDTDWHIDKLYAFAEQMDIGLLASTHSRYVVDLNRSDEDTDLYPGQIKTGLCPMQSFDGHDIYIAGEEPDEIEKLNRVAAYWLPYHEMLAAELQRIRDTFGYAILYDAHSIRSSVPRLFDGRLTDLNLGSARGTACAPDMAAAALKAGQDKGYSIVLDGRFVGGHITRHYGKPAEHIHAIQMELIWDLYMQEELPYPYARDKAAKLQPVLRDILQGMLDWGRAVYGR